MLEREPRPHPHVGKCTSTHILALIPHLGTHRSSVRFAYARFYLMLFGSVWLLKGRQFPRRWRPGKNEELAYADRRGNFISPKNSRFCGKNVGRILLVTYRLLVIWISMTGVLMVWELGKSLLRISRNGENN